MTDPRRWPANPRVAAARLAGVPEGVERVEGEARMVLRPLANLCRTPAGALDRQILFGAPVTVYEDRGGWSFIETVDDPYVGYVETAALGSLRAATHRVSAASTRLYSNPDPRAFAGPALTLNARVTVDATFGRFAETEDGFIPLSHLRAIGTPEPDPVAVAERLLGTPYLWGGNSRAGIDCSGLVQAACRACAIPCPGDSDMQAAELGEALPDGTPRRRGDLLFWKGHVAFVSDPDTLLHANGYHMAVAYEPAEDAIARIAAAGHPVTVHRRLSS
ncbi:C40 family peptidase [Chachezhania sediminis]|uniref:C40 family peptidase n=1 Tax=Chachezhania sediminis TaxID=2599291 RepID=UPI00131BD918|nr:NlpC/P60 family protein [Chachezhania sediminis]